MNFLVIGSAGYIGSILCKHLISLGHSVKGLDNFSTGFRSLTKYGSHFKGDFSNESDLDKILNNNDPFDCVFHLGGFSQVSESVNFPEKYYKNNVAGTITLLSKITEYKIPYLIFSSSAAVYGNPNKLFIDENHDLNPINPYGRTKLMIEKIIEDYCLSYKLKSVALRYFNAAGADSECELGECHEPETHLIPLILKAAFNSKEPMKIYGNDYETKDGTCIRDFIHVEDLVKAHYQAFDLLLNEGIDRFISINLGSGSGHSIIEVINTAKKILNDDEFSISTQFSKRRTGDPDVLVANIALASKLMNWAPQKSLREIIQHAWAWEKVRFFSQKNRL
mgnify:FL=1